MAQTRFAANARRAGFALVALLGVALAFASIIDMTIEDFHLAGTQVGDIIPNVILTSDHCIECHSEYDREHEPMAAWKGSLMGIAGRDPLFYAQMTNAGQDVGNVGYFCMRCHVPMSFVTGHALDTDGSTLDDTDRDGVTCHFCHTMLDPIYRPGISPPEDEAILNGMKEVPEHYGNSTFVLDPSGTRRGPYSDADPPHFAIYSPFHRSGDMCGTCHDVGNVAVSRQPDGTYRYNQIDQRVPDENPHAQFPLERTYTEWKLSTFANGGVDMGGRFGGIGPPVVETCQDCHMPQARAQGCSYGPQRDDLGVHDFAGASAWVLQIAGLHYQGDPGIDQQSLLDGQQKAISMLQRAASLELGQDGAWLRTRVINESGHKLPTGHIEGRRVFVNVKFFDAQNQLLREFGHYDRDSAHLDEESTTVYEMHIGLSPEAARLTGLPPGETVHMSLADVIVKDNRIPPRGFANAAFEAGGAPVVGASYADGQYWADAYFPIPDDAVRTEASVYYQTVTRHYIEALRDGNVTDHWGQTLYDLWTRTDKGPPILMVTDAAGVGAFLRGDLNCDAALDAFDIEPFVLALFDEPGYRQQYPQCQRNLADVNADGAVDAFDIEPFVARLFGP